MKFLLHQTAWNPSFDRILALAIAMLAHALILARLMVPPVDEVAASARGGTDELIAEVVDGTPDRDSRQHQDQHDRSQAVALPVHPQVLEPRGPAAPGQSPSPTQADADNVPRGGASTPSSSPSTAVASVHDSFEFSDLLGRYHAALSSVAVANWDASDAPAGTHCVVEFTQIPGGEVVSARFTDCPFDVSAREAVERAMHKTPMPYAGFETVFGREQMLDFCHPEAACANALPGSQATMSEPH